MKKNHIEDQFLNRWRNHFKKMLLSIPFILFGFISFGQLGTIQIGSGALVASGYGRIPVGSYEYNYSQHIVTAAEYAAAGGAVGNITKIRYRLTDFTDATSFENWTVYIGSTLKTEFTSDTDWETFASLTEVFSGTITPVTNGWTEITFSTPFNYTGGNIVIGVHEDSPGFDIDVKFLSYEASTDNGITIFNDGGDVDYINPGFAGSYGNILPQIQFEGTLGSCVRPFALTATGVTSNSAILSWTQSGPTTDWDVDFGVAGFTQAALPTNPMTTNSIPMSSLAPSTTYEFYVRAVCSITESSAWAGPYSFTTPCVAATIPFFEGFEAGYTDGGDIDGCWSQEIVEDYAWVANNTETDYNRSPRTGAWNATLSYSNESSMFQGLNLIAGTQYLVKFYARQDISTPGSAVITASFGLAPNDAAMTEIVIVPTDVISGNYQEFVAYFTPTTSDVYYLGIKAILTFDPYYVSIDDISVEVAPACAAPTAAVASGMTTTTAEVSWTENGSSTEWDIEYVIAGSSPTGTPSVAGITNPVTLTGLTPSTTYNFYVRAICSITESSTWSGPYTFNTLCAPISTLPWTENFDNMSTVDDDLFPVCWITEFSGEWSSNNNPQSAFIAGPLSGTNYLTAGFLTNSKIWTPEFALTAGQVYEFSFSWAGDGDNNWDGSVYVNSSQSSAGATMLGTSFVENGEVTTFDYKKEIYCFTPTTSGTYSFAIAVTDNSFSNNINFDDFKLKQVVAVPGTDGSLTVCQTGSPVDLNTVITTTVTDGTWNFAINPNAVNVNLFNTNNLASGTYNVLYVVGGCIPDTTVATITIDQPSSAGADGSLAVCRNQPFNLLSGLTGSANFGGVWTDPNAVVVPSGNATASNIPGQYNFKYVVSNGVCPSDTAKVVVNVQGCNYLGLEDISLEGFNMYPNPTTGIVYITNSGSTEVFNYEVLDMNGRVILKANQAINGTVTTEINLTQVEVGVYMVRVFNDAADKTFRIVKN